MVNSLVPSVLDLQLWQRSSATPFAIDIIKEDLTSFISLEERQTRKYFFQNSVENSLEISFGDRSPLISGGVVAYREIKLSTNEWVPADLTIEHFSYLRDLFRV